jgi:hypothetical protein
MSAWAPLPAGFRTFSGIQASDIVSLGVDEERGTTMDRTVARLNIQHFRKLLAEETDESKRQSILRLLAEEEAKLASLAEPPKKARQPS